MSTTGAVAEILVAGLLAILWLLGIFRLLDRSATEKLSALASSPVGGALLLALAYHLGWMVNSVTYWMARVAYYRPLREDVFGKNFSRGSYENLKVAIYANKDREHLIRLLEQENAVDRIARAGGLNFSVLALVVFGENVRSPQWALGVASVFLLALGSCSWKLAKNRHRRYIRLIKLAGGISTEAQKCNPECVKPCSL